VDPNLVPLETVTAQSDLVSVSTPHKMYRDLDINVPTIDVWGMLGNGTTL
jgi:hypothetical protein